MHQPPYVANKHDDHSQSYNGFDEEIILSSDTTQSHNIKVFALDTWGGNNPQIGEATVTVEADPQPTGQVEITSGPKGMVHVRGWAQDQDAPNKSLEVHVYIGGSKSDAGTLYSIISASDTNKTWADIQSANPGATWSKPSASGNYWFDLDVSARAMVGTQTIYVYAINEPSHGNNPEIGHATVTIEKDNQPVGELESVTAGDDYITVKGWARDPDEPDIPLNLHVFVGGRSNDPSAEKITSVWADQYNQSLNRWEFNQKVYVNSRGPKTVYAHVINAPSGSDNPLIGSIPVVIGQDNSGGVMTQGLDRALPDGDYIIASAAAGDKASFYLLDIPGLDQPAADLTNVAVSGPHLADGIDPTDNDVWTIHYAGGFYTIRQKGTDMCLDVYAGSAAAGANVDVCRSNDTPAQRWAISFTNKGYRVISKIGCQSLDIEGGILDNGKNVCQQSGVEGANTQAWLFIPYKPSQPLADGRYIIRSKINRGSDGRSLELYVPNGANAEENQVVQIWDDTADSTETVFIITRLDNGYYKIIHEASGKALEIYGGVSDPTTSLSLHKWNGSNPQQWAIMKDGYNGGYTIKVRSSGYAVDLRSASTSNGSQVRQNGWNGSEAETWVFVPAGSTVVGDELVLPASLKRIEAEAFAGSAAKVVRVPQGCTAIGSGAFRDCPNLRAIYIPASVTSIADNAFQNSPNVIIYGKSGSEALRYAQSSGIPYATY